MGILSIDIETFSSVDLTKCGVYAYTESPDFEILLFGYAFDDEPVQVVDLVTNFLPEAVEDALVTPNIIKTTFNANFERVCIARHFKILLPPEQWQCTAAHALTLGLPHRLEDVAKTLRLAADKQKMTAGKALIRYFSIPCKPTKTNGQRTRNLPEDDPGKWEQFKQYCSKDVEVEREVKKRIEKFPLLEVERRLWNLDQKINDYGVRVDMVLVRQAIRCDGNYRVQLEAEALRLTSLDNPKSVKQLKGWLEEAEGIEIESLNKEYVPELLKQTGSDTVRRVLELRQELSLTSIRKYQAMVRAVCPDQRIRGLLQFYGANRTGRWAGRLVQVHNLPLNKLEDLALARQLVRNGEHATVELLFDSVPGVLSQLIRTAFIPSAGCRFIVSDFSAIEARIIAWLAGEKWRMDVFNSHGKIYEASAAQMFRVPIESIDKHNPLRQKGKVAELSCGYGGGKGALIKLGALKTGLTEEELPEIIHHWRLANPAIVKFWQKIELAAIETVLGKRTISLPHNIVFSYESGIMFIRLPSGRKLAYVRPDVGIDPKFQRPALSYEGMNQETKTWGRLRTYGGKLVENIVQATARDCLREALIWLADAGYNIAFHVHDEVVLDVPHGQSSAEEAAEIMSQPMPWAPGLPMKADAYETDFYQKD